MILVDTSVWIDHLRSEMQRLSDLLDDSQVTMHPMVVGELACGNLRDRERVLSLLEALPYAPVVAVPMYATLSSVIDSWGVGSAISTFTF